MPTRLTRASVAQARRDIAAGHATIHGRAQDLGVRWQTMESAVYGYTWRGVIDPPPLDAPPPGPEDRPRPSYALLTAAIVTTMRREYRAGIVSFGSLAQRYGVAESTVRNAVLGYTWRHVVEPPVPVADIPGATVVSEDDEREIVARRRRGETYRAIAQALGHNVAVVHRAHRRLSRTADVDRAPTRR